MSNRRRLPGARIAVHCARCGKGIGKTARRVALNDGRVVCGTCTDDGALLRRLDCGHMSTAGSKVVRTGAGYSCAMCARDEAKGIRR
jgi:hypothetical protein